MLQYGEFSNLPLLTTPRLILRKLTMADAQDIYSYSHDVEVARYVQWTAHRNLNETKGYLRYMVKQYRSDSPASWGVVWRETNRVIGTAGYMWHNSEHNSAEVGYSLSRAYWNRGVMTEALAAILQHGFESLRLHRIEAQHDVRNPASGRVMEKVGMRHEGTLRGRLYNKGTYVDVELYAILEKDYAALRHEGSGVFSMIQG